MNNTLEQAESIEPLIQQAENFIERRNPEGLQLAERVMQMATQSGNPCHYASAKYILAFYNCLVANDYDKATELCHEALQKIEENEMGEVAYKIYMVLGNSFQMKGELFSAQESYMQGLKQLEARAQQLTPREKGFLGSFYYNVSLLLSTSQLKINSEAYLENAIAIFSELESWFKLSKCYVAYAGVFETKKEYHKAIDILFKALELDERINDAYSIALSKANLGILHLRILDYTSAFVYLNDALGYYSANNMMYEKAMVKVNLGETLFVNGKTNDGIAELLQAEELFAQLDNKRELSNIYEMLAKFMAQTGHHTTAYNYQLKYTDCLKYFFDIEKTNALTRAKKEFETEQKEKEAVLLKHKNNEIKQYVHKLENSNNQLKQFAHVASHDLREPLRMITSYMGLLKKSLSGSMSAQQTEFVNFAVDGAKRMDLLIVDLLRLAKVDANPKIETVRLQSVVEEIKLNLDTLLKEKNAVVIVSPLPEIMADRTQMLQVFQNLIGNGIKYNENAQPTIKVKCTNHKNELEITIADNGIGIPESYRERVFQIFQRVQTAKQYSGSGIGLAICKKIIDGMNGRISILDNPSGGTVFKIVLPAMAA